MAARWRGYLMLPAEPGRGSPAPAPTPGAGSPARSSMSVLFAPSVFTKARGRLGEGVNPVRGTEEGGGRYRGRPCLTSREWLLENGRRAQG